MVIPLNRQHAEHRATAYEDEQHDGRHFDEREQNSVSAKKRTESAFEVKITTMNRALQIHTGVPGNHLRR